MIDIGIGELAWWQALLAVIIGIVGTARVIRLIVSDDFPPSVWLRIRWSGLTNDGPWVKVVTCGWCASPYLMAACIGFFLLSFLHPIIGWSWWLLYSWAALSYAASWIWFHDEDGHSGE